MCVCGLTGVSVCVAICNCINCMLKSAVLSQCAVKLYVCRTVVGATATLNSDGWSAKK